MVNREGRAATALMLAGSKRYTRRDIECIFESILYAEEPPGTDVTLAIGALLSYIDTPATQRDAEKWVTQVASDKIDLFSHRGWLYCTNRRVLRAVKTKKPGGYYDLKGGPPCLVPGHGSKITEKEINEIIKPFNANPRTIVFSDFAPVSRDLVIYGQSKYIRAQLQGAFNSDEKMACFSDLPKKHEILYLESIDKKRRTVIAPMR